MFSKAEAVRLELDGNPIQKANTVSVGDDEYLFWEDYTFSGLSFDEIEVLPEGSYRVRPTYIDIGGVSVPKPLNYAPNDGTLVYTPDILSTGYSAGRGRFTERKFKFEVALHLKLLNAGMLHLDAESASKHTEALVLISGGRFD